jgi:hypothetical protein
MAKEGIPLVDLESDEREARNQKATKVDNAKVPVYLWGTAELQRSGRNNLDANWTEPFGNDSSRRVICLGSLCFDTGNGE